MAGTDDPRTAMADLTVFTGDIVTVEVGTLPPRATMPGTPTVAPTASVGDMWQEMPRPGERSLTTFTVHRQMLVKSSNWLRRRLSDTSVKSIRLSSEGTNWLIMNHYINWLYFGTFATQHSQPSVEKTHDIPDDPEYLDIARIWSLYLWLEDEMAADDATSAFVAKLKERQPVRLPGPTCISHMFRAGDDYRRSLGRLIAAVYAAEASEGQLDAIFNCTEQSFHRAVMIELAKVRIENRQKVASMNSCSFHGHASDEPCESNEKAKKRRRLG